MELFSQHPQCVTYWFWMNEKVSVNKTVKKSSIVTLRWRCRNRALSRSRRRGTTFHTHWHFISLLSCRVFFYNYKDLSQAKSIARNSLPDELWQDSEWDSNSDSSPCQSHSVSRQNTRSSATWRRKCLLSIVGHLSLLHIGQPCPSFFSLFTASCDMCWPQHDVRWGWSRRPMVTGQKKSLDGSSTNG